MGERTHLGLGRAPSDVVSKMVEWLLFAACWLASFHIRQVRGYYCKSDQCDFDEYCCGHNICCTSYNVWQMWYFWLGLVLFLLLLAACFGFWRYRYQQALTFTSVNNPYSRVESSTVTLTGPYPRPKAPPTPDSSSEDEPPRRPMPPVIGLSSAAVPSNAGIGFSHGSTPYTPRTGPLATSAAAGSDHLGHLSSRGGYM